jgi:glycosyltransferase involved in cell wall biosynthesis
MTPLVSIGLPVYNGERYITLAIESILAQTFTDFELIVSDNASTDATREICQKFSARDTRIRYVRHPHNVGVTRNFNGVVDQATAPFFKWASADDIVAPDLLEKCVDVLNRDQSVVLVHSRTRFVDADGRESPREDSSLHLMEERPSERLEILWQRLRYCNAQYGVMRIDALRRTRLFGAFIGSDLCFLAELCLHGKFYEIDAPLLIRRIHGGAASSLTPKELVEHYGLKQDDFVSYYWRHLGEHAATMMRAPIGNRERLRMLALLSRRTWWQRWELTDEIRFLFRHLAGRPYPMLGAGAAEHSPRK